MDLSFDIYPTLKRYGPTLKKFHIPIIHLTLFQFLITIAFVQMIVNQHNMFLKLQLLGGHPGIH